MNDTQTLQPIRLVQSKPFSNISLYTSHYTSLCKQFFDKKIMVKAIDCIWNQGFVAVCSWL